MEAQKLDATGVPRKGGGEEKQIKLSYSNKIYVQNGICSGGLRIKRTFRRAVERRWGWVGEVDLGCAPLHLFLRNGAPRTSYF